ncbi:alpha-amylase family glycosyl hydrolase [Roseinatronobacter alkalisoli]|uniref:Alpha-amylase family glycosyl hydrolase n=1 Tax=Roseinatronobacter alkalisoli TaxID=3028235 RepID=A0ABT5TCY8_9RHOB|nr:alpha-amylase family glycosyl hydrolase [Roseinatronobacter sp. HJB301]MDD7972990.1 alpha-amylase family glycosyl hydrolase [Roseinatronobacter sp. HJB301]
MTLSEDWWRHAVIYQIYPRSFQDDNGDGIGDLRGITRRLGHVAALGVDAIWISPIFTSPMADMGYDVADYCDIDPRFGTLADFDALVARAHELGLKVILDQVYSHSSDQHPFFVESRSSRDNSKADWYVWADPRPDGMPPNNWQAIFGGLAWEWDVRRKQYYFHNFLKEQPDLNLYNTQVQDWIISVLRFWLDRGVDGFRLDAINHAFHDPALRDNPVDIRHKTGPDFRTYDMQYPIHSKNQPEALIFLERLRSVLDEYDNRAFIGEIGEAHHPAEVLIQYTSGKRLHMAYNTALMTRAFSPDLFEREIRAIMDDPRGGWPCWAFNSHDFMRHVSRWSEHAAQEADFARMTAALLLCLPGSVCIYQGEELGLPQAELDYSELADPEGLTFWPDNPGRDGCRTPMPWTASTPHGGFSTSAQTWLPVKPVHLTLARDLQERDQDSVLNFYRRMVGLRRETPHLNTAETKFLQISPSVLAMCRGNGLICLFNFDTRPQILSGAMFEDMSRRRMVLAQSARTTPEGGIELQGNGFILFEQLPDSV